jgi:hypothetical protein
MYAFFVGARELEESKVQPGAPFMPPILTHCLLNSVYTLARSFESQNCTSVFTNINLSLQMHSRECGHVRNTRRRELRRRALIPVGLEASASHLRKIASSLRKHILRQAELLPPLMV